MGNNDKRYSRQEVNEILQNELYEVNRKHKKLIIIISIVLAIVFFLAGVLTYYFIIGRDMLALKWALDKVGDEAYLELTDEEIIKAAGVGATTSLVDQYSNFLTPKEVESFFKDFEGSQESFGIAAMEGSLRQDFLCSGVFVAGLIEGSEAEKFNIPIMSRVYKVELDGIEYDTTQYKVEELIKLCRVSKGKEVKITFEKDAFLEVNALDRFETYTLKQNGVGGCLGLRLIQGEVVTEGPVSGVFIMQVLGSSPAEESGVKPFNKFYKIKIGGKEYYVENKPIDEVFDLLKNHKTVEFSFKELTFNGNKLEEKILPYVEITKREYERKYLRYLDSEHKTGIDGTKKLLDQGLTLDEDTAYIQFDKFGGNCASEFEKAMNVFKEGNKSKLILDLRGNGGGFLSVLSDLAGYLTSTKDSKEKQLILTMKKKDGSEERCYTNGNRYREGYHVDHLVVLCDGDTASASEALMGALMDYRKHSYTHPTSKMYIIGSNTYGKDIVQDTFIMPLTGYGVKVTVAKYFTPSGNELNAENTNKDKDGKIKGIMPNLFVENNALNIPYTFERDKELQAAIKYLKAI